jgi:uncharacterized protein (TIGR02266 family)
VTSPSDSSKDSDVEVEVKDDVLEGEGAPAVADGEPLGEDGKPLRARYAVDFDLTLDSEHWFYAGSATNLSTGGFFVATHILQEIGERFRFTIRLPETNRVVRGTAEVRWHRPMDEGPEAPAGMGIRFVELEEGSQEAIDEFIANRKPLRWDSG